MPDTESRLQRALAGRYAIERELGHGGMATVYLARDLRHGRPVAIKVLRPDLAAAVGGERFLREIAIGAQLQHPNILTLIDSGDTGSQAGTPGALYYVMPYVEGESLRSRLVREGALPVSETSRLLRDVVDALAHAHRHGVVHRDVKPDNVMIAGRHALVVDFGVAKAVFGTDGGAADRDPPVDAATLTALGTSLGTPAYMSPEQAVGDSAVDHRADIYAVGVMAYEMLTGAPPFTGAPRQVLMAHVTATPEPVESKRPDVPPALAAIVTQCLEKDPARRPQSADELLEDLESLVTPGAGAIGPVRQPSSGWKVAPAAALVLAAAATLAFFSRAGTRRERWAREVAIPTIQRLAFEIAFDSAYIVAAEAAAVLRDDPTLEELWPRFASKFVVETDPPGAMVYRAPFGDTTSWVRVGPTPTDSIWLPRATFTRIRLEKPGFRTTHVLVSPTYTQREPFVLDSTGAPNAEMVHVSAGAFALGLPSLNHLPSIELRDFLIDRHEVTNRDYKAFVLAGGYEKPEYWVEEIVRDGRRLDFREKIASFVDKTGRPGPSTWEAGDYPPGQEDLPVGGVSWYEAAAFARFAGKSLPTVYHWARAAEPYASPWIVPGSTLTAPAPTKGSRFRGMSPFGAFDMAGNVREWCANADAEGKRYILGGGWSDLTYAFNDDYAQDAFDRSAINGIRLAKYLHDEPELAHSREPLVRAFRDYSIERPVSDVVFETFRRMYDYDPTPLKPMVVVRDTTPADWVLEQVSFEAAYGHERVPAYLFLPKRRPPPYQTVVFFPGDGGFGVMSSASMAAGGTVDFFVKSGRAVIAPVLKSTFERRDSLRNSLPNESIEYRDHVIMWAQDIRRSIDYLASRTDIDTSRLAYFGVSWGGRLGGLIPAVEPRFKTSVLFVAGFRMQPARPEADPLNFVSRITMPVLMLNGKYDYYFPTETSQQPFFRLLGTPADQKRYVVYEGGHILPRAQLIRESLDWLDKYFGPVK